MRLHVYFKGKRVAHLHRRLGYTLPALPTKSNVFGLIRRPPRPRLFHWRAVDRSHER